MKFKNKKVLVLGLGDSGRAAVKLLHSLEAQVSFYDDNIKYFDYVGFERNPTQKNFDLVVLSPGVKIVGNEIIEHFKAKKIPIISEIDLGFLNCKGKIVAITGTNGKTTVTSLVGKILRESGRETFICGNIGLPFSSICKQTTKKSVIVCEVSSFQLEGSVFFKPNIACILNIKPDHLDWHGSFEEYIKAKGRICQNMKSQDVLVLNLDDEIAKKQILHKKYQFFSKKMIKKGVFLWKNQIFVNKKQVLSTDEIPLLGEKNLENVLASIAICSHFNVSPALYSKAVKNFVPMAHRMEKLGVYDGVLYVDDSKATNVASTVACVEAFKNYSLILLLGGRGKNIDYDEIFDNSFNIKKVVCFGEDGEKIEKTAKKFNKYAIFFEKFVDAVAFCKKNAQNGDCVLLSPACASFDEFSSYAERGDRFKDIVLGKSDES